MNSISSVENKTHNQSSIIILEQVQKLMQRSLNLLCSMNNLNYPASDSPDSVLPPDALIYDITETNNFIGNLISQMNGSNSESLNDNSYKQNIVRNLSKNKTINPIDNYTCVYDDLLIVQDLIQTLYDLKQVNSESIKSISEDLELILGQIDDMIEDFDNGKSTDDETIFSDDTDDQLDVEENEDEEIWIGLNGEIEKAKATSISGKHVDFTSNLSNLKPQMAESTIGADIKYAPQKKVLKGHYNLAFIQIAWADGKGGYSGFRKSGLAVKNNFERLSGGNVTFDVDFYKIKVPYNYSYKNVKAAANRVKNVVGNKYNRFAICTGGAAGISHAGGNTAILKACGAASHEIGHTLGFGHAGRMSPKKKNQPGTTGTDGVELNLDLFRTESSKDGSSMMSTFPSQQLTAPQLYSKGWLGEKQVALHEKTDPTTTYRLQTLNSKEETGRVNAIYIPNARGEEGRAAFISAIPTKPTKKERKKGVTAGNALTFHLGDPSSIRVTTWGGNKEMLAFGLKIKTLKHEGNNYDLEISPLPESITSNTSAMSR